MNACLKVCGPMALVIRRDGRPGGRSGQPRGGPADSRPGPGRPAPDDAGTGSSSPFPGVCAFRLTVPFGANALYSLAASPVAERVVAGPPLRLRACPACLRGWAVRGLAGALCRGGAPEEGGEPVAGVGGGCCGDWRREQGVPAG